MNTPVSFELAKLLKDKGFTIPVRNYYLESDKDKIINEGFDDEYWGDNRIKNWNSDIIGIKPFQGFVSAPTIAEVVMWLYEKHGIWIGVDCDCYGILWYANLSVASEKNWDNIDLRHEIISASKKFPNEHNSPTEAYSKAIEYTLNNLI
jgi:hypothetical protein